MKYPHTRDETIALYRKVIPLMVQQQAGLHPLSYTVFYEHLSGLNGPLSDALSSRRASGPLSDADIIELYDSHVRDRQATRLAQMLSRLMQHLIETAGQAGADLSQFRDALEQRQRQLQEPLEQLAVQAVVASLVGETERMRAITGELSQSLVTSLNEVASLEQRLRVAEEAALTDPLTGLLNRRGFERAAPGIVSLPEGLTSCRLLFIDVDRFKDVNDRFGHLLGDKALCAIADLLRQTVRGSDIVARLGGDEFAALLPAGSMNGARAVGENIRAVIAKGKISSENDQLVGALTVSIGISRAKDGETLLSLLQRADLAMYRAKEMGRNCVYADDDEGEDTG